jgi:hypothetical protein
VAINYSFSNHFIVEPQFYAVEEPGNFRAKLGSIFKEFLSLRSEFFVSKTYLLVFTLPTKIVIRVTYLLWHFRLLVENVRSTDCWNKLQKLFTVICFLKVNKRYFFQNTPIITVKPLIEPHPFIRKYQGGSR